MYNNYYPNFQYQNQYGNQYQNPYQQPQQNQSQMSYLNSIVVNGYTDVEKHIVAPNQTVNFYDGKNGYFYLKSADGMGRCNIKAFKLTEINYEDVTNPKPQNDVQFVTVEEFNRMKREFESTLEHISKQLKPENSEKGSD